MSAKTAKTAKTVNPENAMIEAVGKYYTGDFDLDAVAFELGKCGVKHSQVQATLKKVGIKNGFLLSDNQITEKILEAIKNSPAIGHFSDVCSLAAKIDIKQLSEAQKQVFIVTLGKVKGSIAKPDPKLAKLYKSNTHHGEVGNWIMVNPDFSPAELLASGCCTTNSKPEAYYEEFLAYRSFWQAFDNANSGK